MKNVKLSLICFVFASMMVPVVSWASDVSKGESVPEVQAALRPNSAGKTLMTPSGWGAWGNAIFIGVGGTEPQVYSSEFDGAISLGAGFGHPVKNAGLQLTATIQDVSGMDNISYGIKVHKYLSRGISMAIGAEQLFGSKESTADESFYIAASRASQQHPSAIPGISKLHMNIGLGNGRFGNKSPRDVEEGKSEHGTYLFGGLAYEVYKNTNLILEWSGINLHAGVSITPVETIPVGITVGAADLTSNSGDGVRLIFSVGSSYRF